MKKLILFVYDFPHKKSLKGMQIIKSFDLNNTYVIASPKIKLNFRQSNERVVVKEKEFINPNDLAKKYGWESIVAPHNSNDAISFYNTVDPDYGIILGSRILSKDVINCFKKGIINFHPGVLPENRGLDNLKWAIYNNLPQGVTTHLIDENIDVGFKIFKDLINVELEDTIFDVNSKLLDKQFDHLCNLIVEDFKFKKEESLISNYQSQKAVPESIENEVMDKFENYKKNYKNIVDFYKKVEKNSN